MMRKKILFVLPFAPYPLTSGGSQAIFNGITVVKDDYETFVTYQTSSADEANIAKFTALMDGKIKVLPYVLTQSKFVKPSFKQRLYRMFLPHAAFILGAQAVVTGQQAALAGFKPFVLCF